MSKKLNCVLLVDDDPNCNFFHQRLFEKLDCVESIEIAINGKRALEFLKSGKTKVDLIFLDINMPVMDGLKFLEEYEKLKEEEKAKVIIVMVTTTFDLNDKIKAKSFASVKGFKTKYVDQQELENILKEFFPESLEIN